MFADDLYAASTDRDNGLLSIVETHHSSMKTLLSQDQLRDGVRRMADDVNQAYAERPLTIVGVMTGCIVLLADMIRLLEMPLRVGVVQASSYRDGTNSGLLVINADLMLDISNHDVLVVDDIFDTGNTMVKLLKTMEELGPTSVRTGVLLLKKGRQQVDYQPDFVAFEIPDEFVVGYGLDYRDEYRNLPFLAALEEKEINAPA
jgi:hypoxanthine phosphoribosyltransferase